MKSFLSPLCIGERKGTNCTLLMCSISLAFVSNVIQRAGVCLCETERDTERANFYHQELFQCMLSLAGGAALSTDFFSLTFSFTIDEA